MGYVKAINVSDHRGTFKYEVKKAYFMVDHGIVGDAHAGNWHRQISLLSQDSIDKMTALGVEGLNPGKFAENLTTVGIELHTLPVGTVLKIGPCYCEVTQIGKECHQHCQIYRQVGMCIMPKEGVFVKVLNSGQVVPGDLIEIVEEEQVENIKEEAANESKGACV
jgi:MOSC domain-containing protein YiiM